jgi:hypothetical protein
MSLTLSPPSVRTPGQPRTARPQRRNTGAIIDASGGRYGRLITAEARRARLPLALACALVEQESSFRNVFGHDDVPNPIPKGSPVTRESYLRYVAFRNHGLGNQGVGVTQLTFAPFQDSATKLGGCWKVSNQLRVGFGMLAGNVRAQGMRRGLAAYNAGNPDSPQGLRYAGQVLDKMAVWSRRLKDAPPAPVPAPTGPRTLHGGHDGADVAAVQRSLNRYYRRWKAPELLVVDGDFGPATELAYRRVRKVLGLALARDAHGRVLISPRHQDVLRHPTRRDAAELLRAQTTGAAFRDRLIKKFKALSADGPRPKVVKLALEFRQNQLARNVAIHTTVGHHSAGPKDPSDAEAIELCRRYHHEHQAKGWAGIGYHACIAASGTIILLRPGWAMGAGVEGHNERTFHIMFNGDFRTDRPTRQQIESYRWFIKHGHQIDGIPHQGPHRLGHRDFSGHTSNVCPGPNLHPYVKGS